MKPDGSTYDDYKALMTDSEAMLFMVRTINDANMDSISVEARLRVQFALIAMVDRAKVINDMALAALYRI